MNKCAISIKELSLYADGRYESAKKKTLEKHIEECSLCRERLKSLMLVKDSLHKLSPISESAGFDSEFNRLLDERIRQKSGISFGSKIITAVYALRDSIAYPIPAMAKIAVSFVVVVAVLSGIRTQYIQNVPYVEFSAGDVKIYRPSQKAWLIPKAEMRLKQGDKIVAGDKAILNIVSKKRYKARIKDNSLIVLSKFESGLSKVDTDFSISHGSLLVNTTDRFKGSKMNIYTPSCDAEVVGTAFIVKVFDNQTWLGVLEGRVKMISKVHPLKATQAIAAEAYVSSGQQASIQRYRYLTTPELFQEREWQDAQELYQLTETPQIILLMGTGSDRVEEFLRPAPVYIPDSKRKNIPRDIQHAINAVISATDENNIIAVKKSTLHLEQILSGKTGLSDYVKFLMFVGAHYHYAHDYEDALRVFQKVIREYPDSSFASLAQCAMATIYQHDLKDIRMAENNYRQLLNIYPDSVDAVRAKETLTSLR